MIKPNFNSILLTQKTIFLLNDVHKFSIQHLIVNFTSIECNNYDADNLTTSVCSWFENNTNANMSILIYCIKMYVHL